MSNKPFSEKKASLFRNSLLVLNKEISGNTIWDVPQISRRTEDLFGHFCSIWPSAKDFAESYLTVTYGLPEERSYQLKGVDLD